MSMEKSEAIILRVTDFSETSRIVVLYSRDFGKLSALAKGGRRLKGPFESSLDLLARCSVVFIRKTTATLDLLTEAKLVTRFRPAERELTCLYAGYYVAELLLALTEDYDPSPVLYEAAISALQAFESIDKLPLAVLRFELMILREIGQLPDFETCAGCGARLAEGQVFGFWVSQGGLICPECQREERQPGHVHAGTAAALRVLSGDSDQLWRRIQPTVQQQKEMRQVITMAVSHVLGRRPKMLKLLG